MKLTKDQIESYHLSGYLLLESLFSTEEVDLMLKEMNKVISEDCPRRILEKNGAVRSFFAPDYTSGLFNRVVHSKRLVLPAQQLIGTQIYAHQTKINSKYAMVGDWWEWHRDYTFWKKDDGMPWPNVLTAMIYLNNVNEFNGPMLLIPGSHKVDTELLEENDPALISVDDKFKEYQNSTTYMSALTATLKYTLKQNTIAEWVKKNGIQSVQGKAGSVLFFHGNVFHASSNNLSPWDRHAFLITYNSIENTLPQMENPRPGFIANRNFKPIIPLDDNSLLENGMQTDVVR